MIYIVYVFEYRNLISPIRKKIACARLKLTEKINKKAHFKSQCAVD